MIENGFAHIPEDRQKYGLVMPYSIAFNQILCSYYKKPYANHFFLNINKINHYSKKLIKLFNINTINHNTPVNKLSGGNQQKVILSRELNRNITFLLANQPSRGLDIGAIEYIHKEILKIRDNGVGILLISSDLDEIINFSDNIIVLSNGKIVKKIKSSHVSKKQLGLLMINERLTIIFHPLMKNEKKKQAVLKNCPFVLKTDAAYLSPFYYTFLALLFLQILQFHISHFQNVFLLI